MILITKVSLEDLGISNDQYDELREVLRIISQLRKDMDHNIGIFDLTSKASELQRRAIERGISCMRPPYASSSEQRSASGVLVQENRSSKLIFERLSELPQGAKRTLRLRNIFEARKK